MKCNRILLLTLLLFLLSIVPCFADDEPGWYLAQDSDFTWVEDFDYGHYGPKGCGYFKYTGAHYDYIEIPDTVQGVPMTTYCKMFADRTDRTLTIKSTNHNIKDISSMFYSMDNLTYIDINNINTSSVKKMESVFAHSTRLTTVYCEDIDTSSCESFRYMFNTSNTNTMLNHLDLTKWDVSKGKDFTGMFATPSIDSLDISGWDTSSAIYMKAMFQYCKFNEIDVSSFNTFNVIAYDYMFSSCCNLTYLDISSFVFKSNAIVTKIVDSAISYNETLKVKDASVATKLQNQGTLAYGVNIIYDLLPMQFSEASLIKSFKLDDTFSPLYKLEWTDLTLQEVDPSSLEVRVVKRGGN